MIRRMGGRQGAVVALIERCVHATVLQPHLNCHGDRSRTQHTAAES